MNTRMFAPGDDMVDEVIRCLNRNGNDFSRNLVVFPGKRPAHVLRKRLANEVGSAYLPPQIFSEDEFVEYLYTNELNILDRDCTDLDAAGILLDLQDVLSHILVDDRNRKLESFLPFGIKLFKEIEELKIARVKPARVKTEVNAFLDQYDVRELVYLRDFYPAFYEKLEQRGLRTRAMKYAAVADRCNELALTGTSRIIIAGFAAPNPSEKALFLHLANDERVEFIFQEAVGVSLVEEEFEKLHPEPPVPTTAPTPDYQLYESSDIHGQLFSLAALLRSFTDAGIALDEHTVIVVPKSEALFPLLSFGIAGVPEENRNISLQYPLNRTPVYEFVMALIRAITTKDGDGYLAPAFLEFILHPYVKNIYFDQRADVTRILMHTIEEEFFGESSAQRFTLDKLLQREEIYQHTAERLRHIGFETTAVALLDHLNTIFDATLLRLEPVASIGDVARACADILRYVFDRSTAKRHPLVKPFIQTAVDELDRVSASDIANYTFEERAAHERLLKRILGELSEPFPGTPMQGLQVLGLLETRNLRFERVIILDANDDILPGGRGSDMMLPQRMRERLGLETYRLRERRSGHYFHLLCQGAKEVHLFYRTGNGMERSRFVEEIVWERQKERGTVSEEGLANTIQYNVALENVLPQAIEKSPGVGEIVTQLPLSPSGLDTYLRCPLKFYYRYVLHIKETEEGAKGIDGAKIGTMVHSILESYFKPFIDIPLDTTVLDTGRMTALVDDWFRENIGRSLRGELLLLRTQVQRRMKEFIEQYQLPLARKSDITVLDLEKWISVESEGVILNGKLDRIETRNGIVHILDYKTGGSLPAIRFNALDPEDRAGWSSAIGSLQLPMYVRLYSQHTGTDPEEIVPLFVHLGKSQINELSESGMGRKVLPTSEWYPTLSEIMDTLIAEIRDVHIPFSPPDDPARACRYCEFRTVCGTRWL